MNLILHCMPRSTWDAALVQRYYAPDSLRQEGFIHFSTPGQILPVVNALFRGRRDLVLLIVAADLLIAELRYENIDGGKERFPHLYGSLNLNACLGYVDFPPGPDGTFSLPAPIVALVMP
jgi:uncharacterized protein (DUF952 family)